MSSSDRDAGAPALIAQPSGKRESGSKASQGGDSAGDGDAGQISATRLEPTRPDEATVAEPKATTEQPDPYAFRDLVAQEQMADWAFWMFVATAATVMLTGVGLGLIWRTLVHTRRAANYASDMADEATKATAAAIAATEISNKTHSAIMRMEDGYISLQIPIIKAGPNGHVVTVLFKNVGRTPITLKTIQFDGPELHINEVVTKDDEPRQFHPIVDFIHEDGIDYTDFIIRYDSVLQGEMIAKGRAIIGDYPAPQNAKFGNIQRLDVSKVGGQPEG